MYKTAVIVLWVLAVGYLQSEAELTLEHLSTIYIPTAQNPPTFVYDSGAVEQCAVDYNGHMLYTVGGSLLHVINITDVYSPNIVHYIEFLDEDGTLNDVELCQDFVALAYYSNVNPLEGRTMVYRKYNASNNVMDKLYDVIVGAVPDSLKFTSNCRTIVVAIEGELVNNHSKIVDPEGGVSIIELPDEEGTAPTVTFADFTSFNDRSDEYISKGVRKIYNGQGTSYITSGTNLSQDLEPENLAFNEDESKLYVSLQENNAVAVFDMVTRSWIDIYPLGFKDYSIGNANKMDPSDKDGGAYINDWGYGVHGVFGMFQPDVILHLTFEGKQYVITANEGDSKEYEVDDGMTEDWSELMKGKDILEAGLVSTNVSSEFRSMLMDDSQLARLEMSIVDGLDSNGNITTYFNYGARSISAFWAGNMSLAFDSRDELEQKLFEKYPDVFNSDCSDKDIYPSEAFDSQSNDKGMQPESLAYGMVNNKTVIFLGIERPGVLALYSVVPGSDLELQFENIYYFGGSGDTCGNLWDARISRDVDPEDVRFVPADKSSSGHDMLIVAGATSGTVSMYNVVDIADETSVANGKVVGSRLLLLFTMVILLI